MVIENFSLVINLNFKVCSSRMVSIKISLSLNNIETQGHFDFAIDPTKHNSKSIVREVRNVKNLFGIWVNKLLFM